MWNPHRRRTARVPQLQPLKDRQLMRGNLLMLKPLLVQIGGSRRTRSRAWLRPTGRIRSSRPDIGAAPATRGLISMKWNSLVIASRLGEQTTDLGQLHGLNATDRTGMIMMAGRVGTITVGLGGPEDGTRHGALPKRRGMELVIGHGTHQVRDRQLRRPAALRPHRNAA